MKICVNCQKKMFCAKNGVGADFGNGHVYASDMYRCPECGAMMLHTNENAVFDPNRKFYDAYLDMTGNGNHQGYWINQFGEQIEI